ncbi:MAG: hypothetical protein KJ067_17800 [Vicinamibacteria bacterium]|nr:hypothetical protein [Vicinamibacteria bacterium]
MTAEVAVLNKYAVALAADSAVTVTGAARVKTYNSANKLFSLSAHEPVGVMVYNSAEVDCVPWETIIKEFRGKLTAARPQLSEYFQELMSFIRGGAGGLMSPGGSQVAAATTFREIVQLVASQASRDLESKVAGLDSISSAGVRTLQEELVGEVVVRLHAALAAQPFLPDFDENDARALQGEFEEKIRAAISRVPVVRDVLQSTGEQLLLEACSLALTKEWHSSLSAGVVVAGFGADEAFPSLAHGTVWGLARGKLRVLPRATVAITPEAPGAVEPFAQQDEVHTFMYGMGMKLLSQLGAMLEGLMTESLPKKLVEALPADQRSGVESIAQEMGRGAIAEVRQFLAERCGGGNARSIIDAVGVLPKEDLAMLAESLVNLTSLKRRVTLDVETVGGPIDVAVISRGDGFIWMRRKHYFQPALNPRYFARISGRRSQE